MNENLNSLIASLFVETTTADATNGELSNMQKVLDCFYNWATTSNTLLNPNKIKDVWI